MGADFTLKDNENRNFLHVAIKQGFPVANLECAIIKVCAIVTRTIIATCTSMHLYLYIVKRCQYNVNRHPNYSSIRATLRFST